MCETATALRAPGDVVIEEANGGLQVGTSPLGERTPSEPGTSNPPSIAEVGLTVPASSLLSPLLHQVPNSRRGSSSQGSGSLSMRWRGRRHSMVLWNPRPPKPLRAPLTMIIFFIVGFGLSVGHCIFYPQLSGRIVGDSEQQEEKLRIGTALSFLTQMALTASAWKAYTQWLWRAVDKGKWTAKGLNAGFSADTAPLSIPHPDMFKNYKLGIILAFFTWSLIVPPFFTPAALYVYKSTNEIMAASSVPFLTIGNNTAGHEFAYSPPHNSSTIKFKDDKTRIFSGPRTVLTLLASATASRGEILPIEPPTNHSSYSIDFFGPIVQCKDANKTAAGMIGELLREHMNISKNGFEQIDSAYYAFVPSYDDDGELVPLSQQRYQQPGNMTNELWMTYQRYTLNSTGGRDRVRLSQVCLLYNASYHLDLRWDRGVQLVNVTRDILEVVPYPNDQRGIESNMVVHAYSALMWAVTDQLVGSLGWFREKLPQNPSSKIAQFGAIESPIRQTSLLGSSDLDVYFDFNRIYKLYVYDNETGLSPQRRQDKDLAKNRTLADLVEDLSVNLTVSLMHNKLLISSTSRDVTKWIDVNRYGYVPTSLFIPYRKDCSAA